MGRLKELLDTISPEDPPPGEMVRVFRKQLSMTLKDLEKITGIQEANLSKIENGKIEVTQHYAEVFAAVFGGSPLVFLYPNGKFKKTKQLRNIERRAKQFRKQA